jgi:Fe-S-cluster containining protein
MSLPCVACGGSCCKSHRGVLLDDGSTLLFVNDRCPNLDFDDRCSIYPTRPQACRDFDCSQSPGYLRTHPRVAALLTINNVAIRANT